MLNDTFLSLYLLVAKAKGYISYILTSSEYFPLLRFFVFFIIFFYSFLHYIRWKLIIRTTWRSVHAHRYNSIESTDTTSFLAHTTTLINDFVLYCATLLFLTFISSRALSLFAVFLLVFLLFVYMSDETFL